MRLSSRKLTVVLAALPLALGSGTAWSQSSPVLVQASHGDLTAGCTAGAENGVVYPNTESEPEVAVNPRNPHQAIGVFQQDRWSNGGARAGGVVRTTDGTHFAEGLLPFGACAAPGAGAYERISDVWVSYGPDGTAYASALEFDQATARSAVGAATSFDGGRTWKYAQPVIADDSSALFNDKNSVTADPLHPGTAYQVWDRIDQPFDANGDATFFDGPGYISITHDYGRTWSTPAKMVDTSPVPDSQTIGNLIVANPRTGRLYDLFDWISYTDVTADTATDAHYGVVTSTDQGKTWSAPTRISPDTSIQDSDPNALTDPADDLRTGSGLPNVAIDPVTGELYLAREGTDFTNGQVDQVELQHSTDGGRTWSAPTRISSGPQAPSYTPSIAVDPAGTVSLTYYDVRDLKPGNTTTLPTSTWLYSFPRAQQQKASTRRIAPDFDWLLAPSAGGHFLGDYAGLAASGWDGVRPFFSTTLNAPQTNVYSGDFETPDSGPSAQQDTAIAQNATAGLANSAALGRPHTPAGKTSY